MADSLQQGQGTQEAEENYHRGAAIWGAGIPWRACLRPNLGIKMKTSESKTLSRRSKRGGFVGMRKVACGKSSVQRAHVHCRLSVHAVMKEAPAPAADESDVRGSHLRPRARVWQSLRRAAF